jgi:hypothetical protein
MVERQCFDTNNVWHTCTVDKKQTLTFKTQHLAPEELEDGVEMLFEGC